MPFMGSFSSLSLQADLVLMTVTHWKVLLLLSSALPNSDLKGLHTIVLTVRSACHALNTPHLCLLLKILPIV